MYAAGEALAESATCHSRNVGRTADVNVTVGVHFRGISFGFSFLDPRVIDFDGSSTTFSFQNDGMLFAVVDAFVQISDDGWAVA